MTVTPDKESMQYDSPVGCLVRLIWMMGFLPLLVFAFYIGMERITDLSLIDVLFWGLAAVLIGARFADVKWFGGSTAKGEPANMATWRRFSLLLVAFSLGLWLAARGAAFLLAG